MRFVKKLLIVPSGRVVRYEDELLYSSFAERWVEKIKSRIFTRHAIYDCETQMYGDIPKILGKENVFIFGQYRPHVLLKIVPDNCPYLSAIGNPEPSFLTRRSDLPRIIKNVDAVLISTYSGMRGIMTIKEARKQKIPVALFDIRDQPQLHGMKHEGVLREIFRGFKPKEDFDIFFKKELPLGYTDDIVRPLIPVGIRPSLYLFDAAQEKDTPIFYSGRIRPLTQGDRREVVEALSRAFPEANLNAHETQNTFFTAREYCNRIARSKLMLAPSGISWDSVRLCEAGLAPQTLLVAPKPYVETVGPALKDGENAALYDTELKSDGKYHLKNAGELVEKVRYYLENDSARAKVAQKWKDDVLCGHTVLARSRYILKSIEEIM